MEVPRYCAGMAPGPADFLSSAALGTRVVARYRIAGGFTDALGYLRSCDGSACVIETRQSTVTVTLSDVVAAKAVPEPPARRPARLDAAGGDIAEPSGSPSG